METTGRKAGFGSGRPWRKRTALLGPQSKDGPFLGPRWPKTLPSRKVDIFHFQNSQGSQSTASLSRAYFGDFPAHLLSSA